MTKKFFTDVQDWYTVVVAKYVDVLLRVTEL